MFHRVLPAGSKEYCRAEMAYTMSLEGFGRCLDVVRRHYNIVSLNDLFNACSGQNRLPKRAALITFDDGWRDTVIHALPALQRRKMSALVFVATEVLEVEAPRWWLDMLRELAEDSQKLSSLCDEFGISNSRQDRFLSASARLAALPIAERYRILEEYVDSEGFARQMVTSGDITQAIQSGGLEVASHGHTHVALTKTADLVQELKDSRSGVARVGGVSTSIAFPHGDYDGSVTSTCYTQGFQFLFSSDHAINSAARIGRQAPICRLNVPEDARTCNNGKISSGRLLSYLVLNRIRQ
jgi:peptidoglycan/xylan/chitin deacetylase (PgdA/CDA1 family)